MSSGLWSCTVAALGVCSVLYTSVYILLVVSELHFFSSLCLEKWPFWESVLLNVFVLILLSLCSVSPNSPSSYIITTLFHAWLTPVPCSRRQQVITWHHIPKVSNCEHLNMFYRDIHLFLRSNISKGSGHCIWTVVNYGTVWILWYQPCVICHLIHNRCMFKSMCTMYSIWWMSANDHWRIFSGFKVKLTGVWVFVMCCICLLLLNILANVVCYLTYLCPRHGSFIK